MVDAICQCNDDPVLRKQAAMIAENQLWLSRVRAEKVALIERLRDPTAFAFAPDATMPRQVAIAERQLKAIKKLIDKRRAAGRAYDRERKPPEFEAALPPPQLPEAAERDDYEALREGICDLLRLLRYELRAWSRRKKAVRGFMAIKLAKHYRGL
jgi:hypothetical protein